MSVRFLEAPRALTSAATLSMLAAVGVAHAQSATALPAAAPSALTLAPSVSSTPSAPAPQPVASAAAPAPVPPAAPAAPAAASDKDDDAALSDELKAGKLVRYGFTAGAAIDIHIPAQWNDKRLQREVGVSALPYVVMLPARWGIRGDVTKDYCASLWLGEDAQKTANNAAAKLAVERAADHWPPEPRSGYEGHGNRAGAAEKQKFLDKPKDYKATIFDLTGWDVDQAGRCGLTWVPGIYVGLPGKFTVNALATSSDKLGVQAREFDPVIAAGIAFVPYAFFSLLLGGTLSSVKGDDGKNHSVGSLSIALGGNLDLAGLLFK